MLVKFKIENFKSFRKEATLNMVATSLDANLLLDENTYYNEHFNLRLLRSAVIYGANASGKTKLLDALRFFCEYATSSTTLKQHDPIEVDPFRLNTETRKEPSSFEITCLLGDVIYRYGFEVDKERVEAEWLYRRQKKKEVELFYRTGQDFDLHEREFKVKDIIRNDRVRENVLLLTAAANFNDPTAKAIVGFLEELLVIDANDQRWLDAGRSYSSYLLAQNDKLGDLMKSADFGIQSFERRAAVRPSYPDTGVGSVLASVAKFAELFKGKKMETTRQVYNELNLPVEKVKFSFDEDESAGTLRTFALLGFILESVDMGHTLVIDELDSSLHTHLLQKIVRLVQNIQSNPRAQLIFTTHDTNLINGDLFRRDQIYFVDKDRYGASQLYSLASFKSGEVRKGDNYEDRYLAGRFDATPYLKQFNKFSKEFIDVE